MIFFRRFLLSQVFLFRTNGGSPPRSSDGCGSNIWFANVRRGGDRGSAGVYSPQNSSFNCSGNANMRPSCSFTDSFSLLSLSFLFSLFCMVLVLFLFTVCAIVRVSANVRVLVKYFVRINFLIFYLCFRYL